MPLVVKRRMQTAEVADFCYGKVAVFSNRGPGKKGHNEDAAAVLEIDKEQGLLAVADGAGGHAAGEVAAKIAVDRLAEAATSYTNNQSLRDLVLDSCETANQAILKRRSGSATTLTIAEISKGYLRTYQIGDSMIIVVGQRGKVKCVTLPHSPTGHAVASGLIDSDEAIYHPLRHLVSNLVGTSDMRIELGSPIKLAAKDTVLLATDGLFDNLLWEEIIARIAKGPLEKTVNELVEKTIERMTQPIGGHPSKPDDLTILLFRGN